LIVRSWNEYCGTNRPTLARGALIFGAQVVVCAALVTAVGVSLAWLIWEPAVPRILIVAACSFLFLQSLMHFSGQFSRVAAGVVVGDAPRDAIWRFVVVLAITLCHVLGLD